MGHQGMSQAWCQVKESAGDVVVYWQHHTQNDFQLHTVILQQLHTHWIDFPVRVKLQQCRPFIQRYSIWGELIGYEHTSMLMQWLSSVYNSQSLDT